MVGQVLIGMISNIPLSYSRLFQAANENLVWRSCPEQEYLLSSFKNPLAVLSGAEFSQKIHQLNNNYARFVMLNARTKIPIK